MRSFSLLVKRRHTATALLAESQLEKRSSLTSKSHGMWFSFVCVDNTVTLRSSGSSAEGCSRSDVRCKGIPEYRNGGPCHHIVFPISSDALRPREAKSDGLFVEATCLQSEGDVCSRIVCTRLATNM